ALNIPYTLSGSALNPGDYTGPSSGILTIPPGQSAVQLNLPVVDDNLVEPTEKITLSLTNTTLPYGILLRDQQQTLDVIDNDAATISIANASVTEGNENDTYLVFDVTLTGSDVQDAFTLPFTVTNGSATVTQDYEIPTITNLQFNGPADRSKQIQVLVKGDFIIEKDETLNVALGLLPAGVPPGLSISNATATGTIINNDKGIVQITAANGEEENEVSGHFRFNFLNGITADEPTVINFSLSGANMPDDYTTAFPTSITIPAGESGFDLEIKVEDDAIIEGTESLVLTTTSINSAYVTNISISNSPQTLNILDNDSGQLLLTAAPDVFEGAAGETTPVKFTVELTKATASPF
ncbi:MAG: hypothetical protein EOP54_31445, partial [Sphingobacteriales bacterium]